MKILYVVDYYQPMLGYGSYYVPRALTHLGHEVTILTSNFYYPFPNYKDTAGKILGKRRINPSLKIEDKIIVVRKKMIMEVFTRAIFGGQVEYLKKINPNIVIVDKTASYQTIIFSILKSFYNYKLVSIDAHLPSGFIAQGNLITKNLFYKLFRIIFAKLINNRVDKFVAVQEKTKEIMTRYYGIKSKKIVHIPLGTDLDLYKFDSRKRQKIREQYSIDKRDFLLIYTGKIIKEKGVHLLFEAINLIMEKDLRIKLLLVGSADKEYENRCLSLLNKKYHKSVIWAGFQKASDLYEYFSAADVGVWPLQESMSMNDAASCSVPFIANDSIGARLRISNNNALLYKKGSVSDLAKKIDYLYRNPTERKKMGKNGRKLMEKRFSWNDVAKKYIEFKNDST